MAVMLYERLMRELDLNQSQKPNPRLPIYCLGIIQ